MRLTLKLALVWTILVVLVYGTIAWVHTHRLTVLHDREAVDDQRILARSLAPALHEIWMTSGQNRALEYAKLADAKRSNVRIEITPQTSDETSRTPEAAPPDGRSVSALRTELGDEEIVTTTTIWTPNGPWTLRIVRSTRALKDEVNAIILRDAGLFFFLVLVAGLLSALAGDMLVGRRIRELREALSQTGSGSRPQMRVSGRDELSRLVVAFNRMSSALSTEAARADEERRKRDRAMHRLRHADRLATVGKLSSAIAHEIATPLQVISGYAQMLPDLDDEAERGEVKDVILAQEQRISTHIRALLDYARRKPTAPTEVVPQQAFEDVRLLLAPLVDDQNVVLELNIDDDTPFQGDPQLVQEVLMNLITNAIKFMPGGGRIVLRSRREEAQAPPARKPGTHIVLEVEDDGEGMDATTQERLFDPFYTTADEGDGTGLGLAICNEILSDHHGYMSVSSAEGEGACFGAHFPLTAKTENELPPSSPEKP